MMRSSVAVLGPVISVAPFRPSRPFGPFSPLLLGLGLVVLSGCPDPDSNPRVLWLSLIGNDETRVQLVDSEPPPF
jgi:hypothetical protein